MAKTSRLKVSKNFTGSAANGAVLVRPDGYVGARWSQLDESFPEQLASVFASILGTKISRSTPDRMLGSLQGMNAILALGAMCGISCQAMEDERSNRMTLASEVKRYLVEHLAGRQSLIAEQAVSAIRSSREIPSAERLTDQELMDHFPQLFGDLVKYFLTDADPSTRRQTIEAALKHGTTRWKQNYELVEVVRELGIVRRSILDHGIEKFFAENSQWLSSVHHAQRNLDDFFEDSVAGSVQRYVENFAEAMRERKLPAPESEPKLKSDRRVEASAYANGQPRTWERAQRFEVHDYFGHHWQYGG